MSEVERYRKMKEEVRAELSKVVSDLLQTYPAPVVAVALKDVLDDTRLMCVGELLKVLGKLTKKLPPPRPEDLEVVEGVGEA